VSFLLVLCQSLLRSGGKKRFVLFIRLSESLFAVILAIANTTSLTQVFRNKCSMQASSSSSLRPLLLWFLLQEPAPGVVDRPLSSPRSVLDNPLPHKNEARRSILYGLAMCVHAVCQGCPPDCRMATFNFGHIDFPAPTEAEENGTAFKGSELFHCRKPSQELLGEVVQ
jgi:hypothetical protein